MAPRKATTPPTTQMLRTRFGEPSWPARNPVPVKITVPIMLETTSAVALISPSWRRSPGLATATTSFYELPADRVTRRDTFYTSCRCRKGKDRCGPPCRRVEEGAPVRIPAHLL